MVQITLTEEQLRDLQMQGLQEEQMTLSQQEHQISCIEELKSEMTNFSNKVFKGVASNPGMLQHNIPVVSHEKFPAYGTGAISIKTEVKYLHISSKGSKN
jgi:hypothetical protein